MNTIFIVTEANANVATGHLMECIAFAEELLRSRYEVSFWINDDMENGLKKRIPIKFQKYHKSIENDYEELTKEVCRNDAGVLLFNLREISEKFLETCKEKISDKTKIICIDEFGHRNLQADIIINPMIDPYYWDYGESKAQLFCGAQYLVLPEQLAALHKKKKEINNYIKRIVITLGGVDPKNYTFSLSGLVSENFPEAEINLIIGGGNRNREAIVRNAMQYRNINIRENVSNLPDLLYEADIVICAGGNTLHEAACIGTPAIVLPSMPHEERTAKCFERRGFGIVADVHADWKKETSVLFDRISSVQIRSEMSINGKKISDGLGRKRITNIIQKMGRTNLNENFINGMVNL